MQFASTRLGIGAKDKIMTRNEMIAARDAKDRAAAMSARAAAKPELIAHRVHDGVSLTITNPTAEILRAAKGVGFELVVDMANRYRRLFVTPAELTEAQAVLRPFFNGSTE